VYTWCPASVHAGKTDITAQHSSKQPNTDAPPATHTMKSHASAVPAVPFGVSASYPPRGGNVVRYAPLPSWHGAWWWQRWW
jgi:hypothetical protein